MSEQSGTTAEIGADIREMISAVAAQMGGLLDESSARWVSRPAGKAEIGDATLALYVDGVRPSDDVVVLVSNPRHPHVVGEDVEAARRVRSRAGAELGAKIIVPRVSSEHEGRTYAALPRLHTMPNHRVLRRLARGRVAGCVMAWAAELAAESRTPGPADPGEHDRLFLAPLRHVCDDTKAASDIRSFAERAVALLERRDDRTGQIAPFTTIEHGDFWVGNVLFDRRRWPGASALFGGFHLIDWRGVRMDGYPCADVVRLCYSLWGAQSKRCGPLLAKYRRRLGLTEFEMSLYTVLSLGRLGMNLDHFPPERYAALSNNLFALLGTNGLLQWPADS